MATFRPIQVRTNDFRLSKIVVCSVSLIPISSKSTGAQSTLKEQNQLFHGEKERSLLILAFFQNIPEALAT